MPSVRLQATSPEDPLFLHEVFGNRCELRHLRRIQVDDRERGTSAAVTAERYLGDVHLVRGEHLADRTDHSRPVLIGGNHHLPLEHRVEVIVVE